MRTVNSSVGSTSRRLSLFSLYCRPFVPGRGGRSSGPSQDGCDSRGQHTETSDGVKTQTGDTPRRNDTANLYLLSIFVSSVVPPHHHSRLPALLFLITWSAARCLLHLIFRTVSVHNRPCMQCRYVSGVTHSLWNLLDPSQGFLIYADSGLLFFFFNRHSFSLRTAAKCCLVSMGDGAVDRILPPSSAFNSLKALKGNAVFATSV